jgi:hypothetical protein
MTFRTLLILAALLSLPAQALAQRSHGYLFVAPGRETGYSSFYHLGVGGDWVLPAGVGLGGDAGYLGGREFASGLGVFSGSVSYHVPVRGSKFDPFGLVGATAISNFSSASAMLHWGGGVNYWFLKRLGVRLEFRDHVWSLEDRHLVEFRFGISLR